LDLLVVLVDPPLDLVSRDLNHLLGSQPYFVRALTSCIAGRGCRAAFDAPPHSHSPASLRPVTMKPV
jgi:hypothetical protein